MTSLSVLVFILMSFLETTSSSSDPITTDLRKAMSDMRSKSYYGFVILLHALNDTTKSAISEDVTFLMPNDQQLAKSPISPEKLEEFMFSHAIPQALVFRALAHVPSGTLIPSFMDNKKFRLSSRGKHVFVNNAQIVAPNVCSSGSVKCHGVDAVIS